MGTPAEQHDTLALTRPGHPEQFRYPTYAQPYHDPHQPMPVAASWSHVPPFLATPPAPVIRTNNAAVIGATLGSVALFLSVIPVFGILAWVLAPIGLLSSAIGLVVGFSRHAGRAGAIYGLVSSGISLLICCAWVLLLLGL